MEPFSQPSCEAVRRTKDAERKRVARAKRAASGQAPPKRPTTSATPRVADAERKRKRRTEVDAEQEARKAVDAERKRQDRANRAASGQAPLSTG